MRLQARGCASWAKDTVKPPYNRRAGRRCSAYVHQSRLTLIPRNRNPMMPPSLTRASALAVIVGGALMLQGCLVGAVVGAGAAVVGGTVDAAGSVVGAGFDAVTTSDEETRLKREREQRAHEREQRRCEQRRASGRDC